ncbi:MAG: phage protein gp10 family [Edaphobacter sp.]|nr:phage protein gp10 family [Edaphobacter sp.]
MADGLGIRVKGLSELDAIFEEMGDPKRINTAARAAVRNGAKIVQAAIEERAPERPDLPSSTALPVGALANDIEIHVRTGANGMPYATIGPGKETSHVARWVEYGHRLVRGGRSKLNKLTGKTSGPGSEVGIVPAHPFIRPGFEASEAPAREAMMTTLIDEATKPAKGFRRLR